MCNDTCKFTLRKMHEQLLTLYSKRVVIWPVCNLTNKNNAACDVQQTPVRTNFLRKKIQRKPNYISVPNGPIMQLNSTQLQ